MNNSLIVTYPLGSTDLIKVLYTIERIGNRQTINCFVEKDMRFPLWLQLQKFSISSIKKCDGYITLFNEVNSSRNMATSLFIDLVYSRIMELEHCSYS